MASLASIGTRSKRPDYVAGGGAYDWANTLPVDSAEVTNEADQNMKSALGPVTAALQATMLQRDTSAESREYCWDSDEFLDDDLFREYYWDSDEFPDDDSWPQ